MHACAHTHVVIGQVVFAIIAGVHQVRGDLCFLFRYGLVKLEVHLQRALLLGDCCLILHSWEEQAVFGQL